MAERDVDHVEAAADGDALLKEVLDVAVLGAERSLHPKVLQWRYQNVIFFKKNRYFSDFWLYCGKRDEPAGFPFT